MAGASYDWLPDHHLGVAATLAHADEVIAQVADILFNYQTRPDGIIQLDEVSFDSYSQTVVTGVAPIPRKMPLLVSDAMVSLRNALEHTLFAEVEYRDGKLGEKAARLIEMPAARSYNDFKTWLTRRQKNGSASLSRGSDLLKRIEDLQPFHRRRDPQDHPLALLLSHTNHSKHRAPAITAVRLLAMYRDDQMPRSLDDVPHRQEIPLQVGDVIAETPIGIRVPVTLFPTIGINQPGTNRWPALLKELDNLATWVRIQAVPRLITGTDPPWPTLPARYDITSGQAHDRGALSEGSTVSAVQLHSQRQSAASVRIDMVDTIGQMEGAPSAKQIRAWLDSLSDREILARMSQLKVNFDYEPHIVIHNASVLQDMRADAVRFARLNTSIDDGP